MDKYQNTISIYYSDNTFSSLFFPSYPRWRIESFCSLGCMYLIGFIVVVKDVVILSREARVVERCIAGPARGLHLFTMQLLKFFKFSSECSECGYMVFWTILNDRGTREKL